MGVASITLQDVPRKAAAGRLGLRSGEEERLPPRTGEAAGLGKTGAGGGTRGDGAWRGAVCEVSGFRTEPMRSAPATEPAALAGAALVPTTTTERLDAENPTKLATLFVPDGGGSGILEDTCIGLRVRYVH